MKSLVVLLAIMVMIGAGGARYGSTGRGSGYRTDYSTGRLQWGTGKKESSSFFVTRVVDGDTLRIDRGEKVRLIGVDTPETKHPTKPVQYFGKEASRFTRNAVEHRWVTLDYEVHKRDKYGRLLAYVHRSPDNFFLNAELIKQGYGFAYTRFPFRYVNEFREYERQARSEGRGLWQRARCITCSERHSEEPTATKNLAGTEYQARSFAGAQDDIRGSLGNFGVMQRSLWPRDKSERPVPEVEQERVISPVESATVAPPPPPATTKALPRLVVEDKIVGDCKIKGNINRKGEKIYHLPGGRWYDKTEIDESDGERWFCTEEEAKKSGWRKAGG